MLGNGEAYEVTKAFQFTLGRQEKQLSDTGTIGNEKKKYQIKSIGIRSQQFVPLLLPAAVILNF